MTCQILCTYLRGTSVFLFHLPSVFFLFRFICLSLLPSLCGQTQGEPPGQGEDFVKPSGTDHRGNLPKVSIPMPEEKSMEKCRLHPLLLPNPRLPVLMSFVIFLAVTLWWLVFLWALILWERDLIQCMHGSGLLVLNIDSPILLYKNTPLHT